MKTIATLLAVHNRKEKTLKCLDRFFYADLSAGYQRVVYLVNDGSTDGTEEAVRSRFPEVKIINGDGFLYWNRGMHLAWNTASKSSDYDYYLWLNDDTFVFNDALKTVIDISESKNDEAIIVGATCSSFNKDITTYGGRDNKPIPVNGEIQKCITFNGNFVLVPRRVFNKLGNLDYYFRHSFGDIEYGLRANKYGINSFITGHHIGICDVHEKIIDCFNPNVPLLKRISNFYSPLGMNPFEYFYMNRKYKGLYKSIRFFITKHIRILFPIYWK